MADFLQPNRGYVYVNGSTVGTVAPTEDEQKMRDFPECECNFKFSSPLIRKANDYSVSI